MDPIRTRKNAIFALIFSLIPAIIGIFGIFIIVVVGSAIRVDTDNVAIAYSPFLIIAIILGIILLASNLTALICYIFTMIETSKMSENNTAFILLAVGLIVPVVGLVGLIITIADCNRLLSIKTDNN